MTNTDADGSDQWLPFGLDSADAEAYTTLTEDVPSWLAPSLWGWINAEFIAKMPNNYNVLRVDMLREAERVLRRPTGFEGDRLDLERGLKLLHIAYPESDPFAVWRLVDFCLSKSDQYRGKPNRLESLLVDAGSAWTVGTRAGKPGLVRRVPEGVVVAAEATFALGDAGERLRGAWEKAFGLEPEPDVAYSRAVKAVEDAAIPIVSPTNKMATLGTVIAQLRSGGKFSLPMLREHRTAPSHDVLLGMLQLLWTGQHDRHGGNPTPGAPSVTQDEAEAAVLLAATLVGWFATGKVEP